MNYSITFRVMLGLLALAVLLQPFAPLAKAQQTVHRGERLASSPLPAAETGSYTVFLPVLTTPPGPPDFEIISPSTGWTVSGMMYFAAQARDPQTVSSVTFSAGATPLGTDSTAADGFRVFFDAGAFAAGDLTLTAVASGPSGQTSKSITVHVVPNPPASGVIGAQGGVLASEIGSIITIPPGALPNGTLVTVDELSQAEVTARNGIDWEAMGVTFLGAQEIQSAAPFVLPYQVASAGFGNRVQPGQVVVNYQIMPDADGDGVDEIVVVNSASVAPNNDVISDPIPQILLADTATVSAMGILAVRGLHGGLSGPPGTSIEIAATGFNPYSLAGNTAVFRSLATGAEIELPGLLSPDLDGESSVQTLSVIIPMLPAGLATLSFRNESTGDTTEPITIMVETPTPISRPANEIIADFFSQSLAALNEIEGAAGGSADLSALMAELSNASWIFEQLGNDPTPETQQFLVDMATLIENSGVLSGAKQTDMDALLHLMAGCFTKTQLKVIRTLALVGGTLASLGCGLLFTPVAGGLCAAGLGIAYGLIEIWFLADAECPPPTPPPACPPTQTGGGGATGMGAAPPPGGNGCGNAGGPGGGGGRFAQGAGGMIIKVFSAGSPIPFSGVTDPGGYFFVPLIPAGEPFTAVAYDMANNETRFLEGIGPATGDFVFLFFDFFSEQDEINTVYWDGEGDGVSWHDPFNWNPNIIPGPTQNVVIDAPGNVTIVHSQGNDAVLSLHSEAAIRLSGGTLDIGQSSILSSTLTLSGGTLTGNGNVQVSGLLTWNHGTMSGIGTTTANGGISFSGNFGRILNGRMLVNAGTAVFQDGTLTASNGALISNQAGATFDFQGDDGLHNGTGGATFNNLGTLIKSAGSGSMISTIPLNNSGTVHVQAGTLSLNGGGAHSGAFQGSGTLAFGGGAHTFSGTLSGLNVRFSSGTFTMNGSYTAAGTTLSGGTFNIGTGLTANSDTLTLSGGTLTGNGNVQVSGLLTWNHGTMSGIGTTTANGGISFSGNFGRILNGRMLVNAGTAVFQDGTLTASNGALVHNLSAASWTFQGDDALHSGSGGGTFQNDGSLTKLAGSGLASVNLAFINNGSIDVQAGQLRFGGGFTQSATGILYVQIGGLVPITDFDQFIVTGNASLDGTLDVTLINGYVPDPGDSFIVMTFTTRTGQFAVLNGHGQGYTANYNPLNVTLVAQ